MLRPPPRRATSLGIACAVGIAAALLAWHTQRSPQHLLIDFDQNYAAARFLREGRDPYQLIGPGREFNWQWPWFYPLTTAVFALPFTFLPMWLAPVVFAGIGGAAFALALEHSGQPARWRYLALLSKPFLVAVVTGQASCLLASAFILAPFVALAAIKPNIGAAIVAARADRRGLLAAVLGGALLFLVSLALRPAWIPEWLAAIKADPFHIPAVGRPAGFLLLLAALRWRRADARLLLALSLVPQTLFIYDALPLFFIPRRATEAIGLVVLSHFAFLMSLNQSNVADTNAQIVVVGNWVVWCLFLPVLGLVLIRPNRRDAIQRSVTPGAPQTSFAISTAG
jgi:hypothetical protein